MRKRSSDAMLLMWRQEAIDRSPMYMSELWRLTTASALMSGNTRYYGTGVSVVSVFCWRRVER